MKKLSIGIAILSICVSAFAGTNGGTGGAFSRMGAGIRAKGLGNAFCAVAEGPSALYFNPGALPFHQKKEFSASSVNLALDRRMDFIGFSTPLKPKAEGKVVNAGVALGWIHASVSDIDSRDYDGAPLEMIDMSSNLFQFGFGIQFHEKLGAGIGVKKIYETFGKIGDEESSVNGDGFGIDAGVFARPIEHLSVGAQIKDVNSKTTWNTTNYWSQGTSKTDEWPLQYRIGLAYERSGILGAFDLEGSEENEVKTHAGVEGRTAISDRQWIAGRLGLDGSDVNIGAGFGFAFWKVLSKVDLVYTLESVAPDDAIAVSWGVEF
ncbi:hypothetical protein IT157_07775 [bacterium]|nr:hypothetical protein [bacterium]